MEFPTIVIVAYNRVDSLVRLLNSLNKAHYPIGENIRLVISIDYSDKIEQVSKVAEEYSWLNGDKIVVCAKKNLGLKAHILQCGDFTEKYGAIIMLEDDLYVASGFYNYSYEALQFYSQNQSICGISLYKHELNVNNMTPFVPLDEGYDNFFLQFASSWGQAWSKDNWLSFKEWYLKKSDEIFYSDKLPSFVNSWPESSWLKWYTKFLVECNKYFVYPSTSYSTNFSTPGTNMKSSRAKFQVPLSQKKQDFSFADFLVSNSKYDSFFEIIPDYFKNSLETKEKFDVDLYGSKDVCNLHFDNILTTKKMLKYTLSFGRTIYPQELNVTENIVGEEIFYGKVDDLISNKSKQNIEYHFKNMSFKDCILLLKNKIIKKLLEG